MFDLPDEVQAQIRKELQAGESLRWAARPHPKFFTEASKYDLFYAIPMVAFMGFWVFSQLNAGFTNGAGVFALLGVPPLLFGLWKLITPLFNYFRMRKTVYAVTNFRAMIFAPTLRSFYLEDLEVITRKAYRNGRGDIFFAYEVKQDRHGTHSIGKGFENIEKPHEVEALLRKIEKTRHSIPSRKSFND